MKSQRVLGGMYPFVGIQSPISCKELKPVLSQVSCRFFSPLHVQGRMQQIALALHLN